MSGLTPVIPEPSPDEVQTELTAPTLLTIADLLSALGDVAPERVLLARGYRIVTEQALLALDYHEVGHLELVDGVLVRKVTGIREAYLGMLLMVAIEEFAARRTLGFVLGGGAWIRLAPGLVRIPDVSFIRWDRIPERQVPREPLPDLVPDLVVEFFKAGSSHRELERKRREYFAAGVRLVWYVDPTYRAVTVYTGLNESRVLSAKDTLDGGDVLPGFAMSIEDWFAKARGPGKQD